MFPTLEQINNSGGRFYQLPDGTKYPSVTTVLGAQPKTYINEWRKRVGDEEADRVSARAAGRGTRLHKYAEDYFSNKTLTYDNIFDELMVKSMLPVFKDIGNVKCIEQRMFSHILRSAGTVDLIGEYKGVKSVIDWKTSNSVKYHNDIQDYFMQAAVYATMYYEHTGIPIRQIVIVIAVDADNPQVFIEKVDRWIAMYKEVRKQYDILFPNVV